MVRVRDYDQRTTEEFERTHKYSRDMLDALPIKTFIEKWKMFLALQDDHVILSGTPDHVEGHMSSARHNGLLDFAPPDKFPRLLALGCGGGEAEGLKRLGYGVTGLTLGPLNIGYSKEQYGLDLVYGDMHDLHFPKESFDVVTTIHSFEHCYAPCLVAMEIWYVLRVHGIWFLVQPDPNQDVGFNPGHPTMLTVKQREAFFQTYGFRILKNIDSCSICEKMSDEELDGQWAMGLHTKRRSLRGDEV